MIFEDKSPQVDENIVMNYRGHTLVNTIAIIPTIYAINKYTSIEPHLLSIGLIGYAMGTLLISPDLDIYSRPYQNWKWLRFIWLPYQKMLRHRSKLTHSPLIGTLFRSLYLFCIFSLFYAVLTEFLNVPEIKIRAENYPLGIAALLGIEAASIVHILTDWVYDKLPK